MGGEAVYNLNSRCRSTIRNERRFFARAYSAIPPAGQ
jgi:hypothetical protein